MRSTTERMKLLKKRTDEIKKRRSTARHMLTVTVCHLFCIALIAVISALICDFSFTEFEKAPLSDTASIFTDKVFLGYAVIGFLAFLLGVSVTLLCDMLHKRRKERDTENDGNDG